MDYISVCWSREASKTCRAGRQASGPGLGSTELYGTYPYSTNGNIVQVLGWFSSCFRVCSTREPQRYVAQSLYTSPQTIHQPKAPSFSTVLIYCTTPPVFLYSVSLLPALPPSETSDEHHVVHLLGGPPGDCSSVCGWGYSPPPSPPQGPADVWSGACRPFPVNLCRPAHSLFPLSPSSPIQLALGQEWRCQSSFASL